VGLCCCGSAGGGGSGSSGTSGGAHGKADGGGGFFKSDSWTKTVGTFGAIANWAIPLAGITHMMSTKDPATTIDPVMTSALAVYSVFFMRWALAVSPANYPLLLCHISNEVVQLVQLARYATAPAPRAAITSAPTTAAAPFAEAPDAAATKK